MDLPESVVDAPDDETPIARAVRLAGGASAMARLIANHTGKPITPEAVRKWVVAGRAPSERCPAIVAVTAGTPAEVTFTSLRPDVYVQPSAAMAPPGAA